MEKTWFNEDKEILDFKAVKNELESFTYDIKNNIDSYGSLEKYVDENTRTAFLKRLNETVEWIYGEGQSGPTSQFRTRLDEFKKIAYPIKARFNFHNDFPVYLK